MQMHKEAVAVSTVECMSVVVMVIMADMGIMAVMVTAVVMDGVDMAQE
jgi:hypothetical protein